jgi:CRP-like cAMP-binding protein
MPLSTIERVLLLRGVDLFQKIPGEDIALIAQVCDEVTFQAGGRIITQGELGTCLYILVDGEATIEIEGVGTIARRGSREVIGEMALLSSKPRSAHCVALTDITALRIEQSDFQDLLAGKPTLALGVIAVLLARLDETIGNLKREVPEP